MSESDPIASKSDALKVPSATVTSLETVQGCSSVISGADVATTVDVVIDALDFRLDAPDPETVGTHCASDKLAAVTAGVPPLSGAASTAESDEQPTAMKMKRPVVP